MFELRFASTCPFSILWHAKKHSCPSKQESGFERTCWSISTPLNQLPHCFQTLSDSRGGRTQLGMLKSKRQVLNIFELLCQYWCSYHLLVITCVDVQYFLTIWYRPWGTCCRDFFFFLPGWSPHCFKVFGHCKTCSGVWFVDRMIL